MYQKDKIRVGRIYQSLKGQLMDLHNNILATRRTKEKNRKIKIE